MRTLKLKYLGLGFLLGLILAHLGGLVVSRAGLDSAMPARPVMSSITASSPSPFDVIYLFYKAVEEGDGRKVRELVTPDLWNRLQQEGFLQQWQARKNLEPELSFVLFLVSEQHVDETTGQAWAQGRAEWKSPRRGIISSEETIRLVRSGDTWKISALESDTPLQAANELYNAIQQADWSRLRSLIESTYWRSLTAAGIISALKKDRQSTTSGVYVVFYARDFALSGNQAWVKGDVIWKPLSPDTYETPATISLIRAGPRWVVTHIAGHWEIKK
ncbi:MAG: hypothetical protein ACPLSY_01365 [Moorellaceae bacterium]